MKKLWTGPALVLAMCVAITCAFRLNGLNLGQQPQRMAPRCPSASKPCRIKAEMHVYFLPPALRQITSWPCSCPQAEACSGNWDDPDRVVTRELITNGNLTMTLSMMFCQAIQPTRKCQRGEVALQMSGWSSVPTDVDVINCSCRQNRPLMPHTVNLGADHRQHHTFVCAKYKDKCKRRRPDPDMCMVVDQGTHSITYPCKCTSRTSCQPDPPFARSRFICKPSRRG